MTLERLTEKTKELLNLAAKDEKLSYKQLLKYITDAEGMGKRLIDIVPPIDIKKAKDVNLETLLKEAFLQSIRLEHSYVGTEHIYLALLKLTDSKLLDKAKIELVRLSVIPNLSKQPVESARKTPILDAFGEDITQAALRSGAISLVYRKEYEQLVSALLLRDKANVLLVGEPGVGRTSLIKLLAYNINSLNIPPALVGHSIRSISLLSFMTNAINRGGDFGIASLIEELKSIGRVIVVLDNFQDIVYSSPAGLTIPIFYSMLKTSLEEAGISAIASFTPATYDKILGENESLIDNFTVVEIDEPSEELVKKILNANSSKYADFHNIKISPEILDYIYEKALKDIKNLKFPQKALDLLDYACAYVIAKRSKIPSNYKEMVDKSFELASDLDNKLSERDYDKAVVIRQKIGRLEKALDKKERKIFGYRRNLNLTKNDVDVVLNRLEIVSQEKEDTKNISRFSKLAANLKKEIIGQDEAIDIVSKALVRSKLGLRSRKRPLGNFLFLGPTGVGKTELAKILARVAFAKDEWQGIIRLDMSDFGEKHNVARLIGAPPGYVGYGEGGELTSKIEAHPNSVVLFDEIEKAHPDVLNILLQIMEEGELSDAKGNTFDFSKSAIILTSNIGTEILHSKGIGFEEKEISDKNVENRLKENLKKILKPELLNRFDEIIVFSRLSKKDQTRIVNLLLKEVNTTLLAQQVLIKLSPQVKEWILNKGYSREFGARALRRTIEKEFLDKVAEVLLENETRPLKLKCLIEQDTIKIIS